MYVPCWALRPGAYSVLEGLAAEMPLWLLLHSFNADHWKPCYHTRDQLGATIGVSPRTISRRLTALSKAALLLEINRGLEPKSRCHRPPARWALDPFKPDKWRPKVEAALAKVAEDDGQSSYWLDHARRTLERFEVRSHALRNRIGEDMLPNLRPKRHKRRKSRGKNASQGPVSLLYRRAELPHEGGVTRGSGERKDDAC